MLPVKIDITATGGTVWGKVKAQYRFQSQTFHKSCDSARCTLRIPQGVTVHLSQSATDSSTWPFKKWQVREHNKTKTMTSGSISLKAVGNVTVTAVYVVAQSSSSGYGGNSWP
jgi:hypothetical protein